MDKENNEALHRVFTIPNLLSFLRLLMIPLIVWLYVGKHDWVGTAVVLVLSGITDVLDGFIARHFNMVSDLGKALDPVADKLTQIAVLGCLVTRYRTMIIPLCMLVVKELTDGILSLIILKKTGEVYGALWHGKVCTILLYATMILHVIWPDIPAGLSTALTVLCAVMILLSLLLYIRRNVKLLEEASAREAVQG